MTIALTSINSISRVDAKTIKIALTNLATNETDAVQIANENLADWLVDLYVQFHIAPFMIGDVVNSSDLREELSNISTKFPACASPSRRIKSSPTSRTATPAMKNLAKVTRCCKRSQH
ncbi:hypothetical protein [Xanthomonas phage JGB6]|nr:hypothetical protein [Xanthomonas phage JGB6]